MEAKEVVEVPYRIVKTDPNVKALVSSTIPDAETELWEFTVPDRTGFYFAEDDFVALRLTTTAPGNPEAKDVTEVYIYKTDANKMTKLLVAQGEYAIFKEWVDITKKFMFGQAFVLDTDEKLILSFKGIGEAINEATSKFLISTTRASLMLKF